MTLTAHFTSAVEKHRQPSAFTTSQAHAKFLAAYDAELKQWPVPYEELDVPTRFGTTHVVACGPTNAPPLVLLHGYMATATMWSPNIAAFSRGHRVYAVDVMGQPGKRVVPRRRLAARRTSFPG